MLYVCLKVIEENGTRGKRFLWKSSTTIQNVLSSGHTLELCKIYQAYNNKYNALISAYGQITETHVVRCLSISTFQRRIHPSYPNSFSF